MSRLRAALSRAEVALAESNRVQERRAVDKGESRRQLAEKEGEMLEAK